MENVPESLRLFMLCEAMNWGHLPVAGGLYQQHPRLLEDWLEIFQARTAHDEHQKTLEERKQAHQRARP